MSRVRLLKMLMRWSLAIRSDIRICWEGEVGVLSLVSSLLVGGRTAFGESGILGCWGWSFCWLLLSLLLRDRKEGRREEGTRRNCVDVGMVMEIARSRDVRNADDLITAGLQTGWCFRKGRTGLYCSCGR